jgi:hypothetical protein
MGDGGLIRGAYQMFEPGQDPIAQANVVTSALGMLGPGDLPATADLEVTGGQSPATIAANLNTWISQVQSGTGRTPMLYSSAGFWNANLGSTGFGNTALWVADWGVQCPNLPSGWSSWVVWQSSDSSSVPGIPAQADRDEFNGDLAALQAFASGGGPASDSGQSDAGSSDADGGSDAGASDAGSNTDAGAVDAGPGRDGGARDEGLDAGSGPAAKRGCGCDGSGGFGLALLAASLGVRRLRRRARTLD